jgi:hypothetical protein
VIKIGALKGFVIGLLSLFLLCFPKGGIKYLDIPITWGYLFVCALCQRMILEKKALCCLIALTPFQIISLITIVLNGQVQLGYTCSYVIHFFLIPMGLLLVLPMYMDQIAVEKIFWWIKVGVFFVAAYGLFLFGYKLLTGSFLEIPFLTVNYHDMYELEYEKCIDRGGIFKLISTYNNGNLYGICILMLLPLYSVLESSFWKRWVVKSSLILTLSRTIWLGLIAYELLRYFFSHQKGVRRSIQVIGSLIGIALGLFILREQLSLSSDFFLDRFLGNRIGQLEVLKHIEWFSTEPFNGIYEVIYLGTLLSFGVVGLITFLFGMTFPLLMYSTHKQQPSDEGAAIALGLVLYLLIACSDGALLLLPVMCFYWFLTLLLITLPEGVGSKSKGNYVYARAFR